MADMKKITANDVAGLFGNLSSIQDSRELRSGDLWPYYEAAAVVPSFRPMDLTPVERTATTRADALQSMMQDCVPESAGGEITWRLRGEVRRAVLQRMAPEELRKAIDASVRLSPDAQFGPTLWAVASGRLRVEDLESIDDVGRALSVASWLNVDEALQHKLRRRYELLELLKPFQALVGEHFRGRTNELRKLAGYVGVTTRSTIAEIGRQMRGRVPLSVHGPGGVGKSTLIARFILDHASAVEEGALAFAYLDADRPTVVPEDPRLLVLEIARQLGIQFPEAGIDADRLRAQFERAFGNRVLPAPIRNAEVRASCVAVLQELLENIRVPLLLVFDTFERVQTRSRVFAQEIGAFIADIQSSWPLLRPVFVGRAPILDFKTEQLALSDLDSSAAAGFLEAHGVADPEVAKRLVSQLGGNPLTLRLAAELVLTEATSRAKGLEGVSTTNLFFLRLDERLIQGQLYRRILAHIADEDVRRLAHPGLAVRRVTPSIIRDVLAIPCGIDVPNLEAARELYNRFAREVGLVERDPGGGVRHRPDVRKVMLRLLNEDDPERTREIHTRAVEFYRHEKGSRARAEEIYHRLMLGHRAREVDQIWRPSLDIYLTDALDELPPAGQAWLKSKIGDDLGDSMRRDAELPVWESAAVKNAGELLSVGKAEEALRILRERGERSPGSKVYALETQALIDLERFEEALAVVRQSLTSVRSSDRALYLELALQGARVAESIGDHRVALDLLAEAAVITRAAGDLLGQLRIALDLYRVSRASGMTYTTAEEQKLLLLYRNTPRALLTSAPLVVAEIAVSLAHRDAGVVYDAVGLASSGAWTDERLAELASLFPEVTTEEELRALPPPKRGKAVTRLLSRVLGVRYPDADTVTRLVTLIRDSVVDDPRSAV